MTIYTGLACLQPPLTRGKRPGGRNRHLHAPSTPAYAGKTLGITICFAGCLYPMRQAKPQNQATFTQIYKEHLHLKTEYQIFSDNQQNATPPPFPSPPSGGGAPSTGREITRAPSTINPAFKGLLDCPCLDALNQGFFPIDQPSEF